MDTIRAKLTSLRQEADAAVERAEEAEKKIKVLEQGMLQKDQDIKSLEVKLARSEADVEKAEKKLEEMKHAVEDGEQGKSTAGNLTRKVQLLEDELDASEKHAKETVEKLRQVDVKAEHFERQVQRLEQERDQWEKKYEVRCLRHQCSRQPCGIRVERLLLPFTGRPSKVPRIKEGIG
ncbi:hypothetical protein FRB95_004626 [Tulasnella sp. JGI-2019a]|nr:hypothetical protein FRB93_000013 [Tulasnella sp. JGI-2019a]KAG9030039.1 hypothetical protein FRB95_004626 [Tulasnella sp. JGI-2019a]